MFGRLIANRIDLAAYFALWGLEYHGVWDRRGNRRPVHHTFRMLHSFGSRVVRSESDQELLAVYAALREEDGALSLLLINKSPAEHYRVSFDLQGFQMSGAPVLLRQAEGMEGVPVAFAGPVDQLELELPPYSTTVAVIPGKSGLPRDLVVGGIAGAIGLAGLGAAAAYIRRRRRLSPETSGS